LSDHTTSDDASRYRSVSEVNDAWQQEPLVRVRKHLTKLGAWSEAQEEALKAECAHEVEAAVDTYLSAARPSTDAMFDTLLEKLPKSLREQRESARRYNTTH
jgi:pyruvate dehydrogenase E1 component alpha subunit